MSTNLDQATSAPWKLQGTGYMFLYNFPKNWAEKSQFMPVEQRGEFQGGLGTLMLVDYEKSNVGPYRELLLIPGRFSWHSHRCYAISRIWVSSAASVIHGRKNWGIPKQKADFRVAETGPRQQSWDVLTPDGQSFFHAELSYGRLSLPIHTAFLPFPLLQTWQGEHYLTRFSGYGVGRLAKLEKLGLQGDLFPDISAKKPLFGLRLDPFYIQFPIPKMVEVPVPLLGWRTDRQS